MYFYILCDNIKMTTLGLHQNKLYVTNPEETRLRYMDCVRVFISVQAEPNPDKKLDLLTDLAPDPEIKKTSKTMPIQ